MADVSFEKFGGLNLIADPQEAGAQQALSCLNVALDRNGRLRTRDGYDTAYTVGADENFVTAIHPVGAGTVVVATQGNKVRLVDLGAGTSSANVALSGGGSSSFASAGSAVYFTDGTATQIRKLSGGAFSSPAGLAAYEGNYLAVQPLEDRLVIADANSTSKLWFSNPATPETVDVANFLELTPGDGEPITGMCVFGTELFVFKRTKFFVFYGNSTDSTGGSIFNYRMVDTGIGCDSGEYGSSKLFATHETGAYFVGNDGIYRTVGGPPVKVSQSISPAFKGSNLPMPAEFSAVPSATWTHLGVSNDRLFAFTAGAQYVMSLDTGEWVAWNVAVASVIDGAAIASVTDVENYRGAAIVGSVIATSGHSAVFKMSDEFTDDDGTAISWHHQSGWYDLGSPNSKRVGPFRMWGTGTVTVSLLTDYGTSDSRSGSVTLGAGATARGTHQKTYRGRLFSHKLSGSGTAVVNQASLTVRDQRAL